MKTSMTRHFWAALLVCLILTGLSDANARKKKPTGSSDFSYYLLVMSYAPDFCAQPQGKKDPQECGTGRHISFVVHGLWPQGENSRGPENCGPASPVPKEVIRATLKYIPTESLIQHEWAAHGTCSGLSAADYFGTLAKARDSVTLPPDLAPSQQMQLGTSEIESKLAAANPSFPKEAFRVSCYNDRELQEIRVCLNKDLSPRGCGPSAGQCSASTVTLLPVR